MLFGYISSNTYYPTAAADAAATATATTVVLQIPLLVDG